MKELIKGVVGMKGYVIYTTVNDKHYRFYDGTWAWWNHNPGNVKSGFYSARHHQIGVEFLKAYPNSLFQKPLKSLMKSAE